MFGFFRNELLEVIEWKEEHSDLVVWRFPDKDSNIKYGAQLTVRDSQSALFLNEGQIADVYYSGRHKLVTENMPILTSLKAWKFGFDSPFKADVYFVSTRQFTNLKWGTPNPVIMRDPQFKQVRVKAFGTYRLRVKDPRKFFVEYAGTSSSVHIEEVEDNLRGVVSPKFAEALAESGASVLDMVSNYTELGEKIRPILQRDLEPLGLELTHFQISSTSLPKAVEEFYDKMTTMHMVDDMNKYQNFQHANAVERSAETGNYENFNASQMNMMMQQMMMNQMQQQNPQQGRQVPPQQEAPKSEAPMSRDEIMKTLKELGELKQMGVLTDEEFDTKKKELLAKL